MIIQRLAKLLVPWDPPRGELCLRVAVSSACGVSLAVATIPWGFPTSVTFLMGIVVPTFSFALPPIYFSIGLVYPWFLGTFAMAFVNSTMLLAAATVSDGLFVFISSLYTFLIMGMYFGRVQETTAVANMLNAIAVSVAVTLRPLVQNGLLITLPTNDAEGSYFDLARDVLAQACFERDLPEDCWTDSLPTSTFPVTISDDRSDMLGGRTVYVTPSDEGITVEAEGGLWIVAGLWRWQGLDNPFAVYRNLLIMLCWCVACFIVAVLIPTMTSGRAALSQLLVPAALMKAIVVDKPEEQNTAMHLWNTLDGSLAKLTIYEPRLLRAPFQALWPQLQDLIITTQYVMDGFILRVVHKQDPDILKESDDIVKNCAKVLMENNPQERENFKEEQAPTKVVIANETQYLYNKCVDLQAVTMSWFNAIDHPTKTPLREKLKNIAAPFIGSVLMQIQPLERIFILGSLLFRPRKWNIRGILWAFKASIGFAALICMQVYWDAWANFAIQTGVTSAGTVFSGWDFYAYAFAWRPTVEGTFKKGCQRILGVLVGGFLGWLGVVVCSWSYDNDAVPNPYGLVVWITVFTVVAAYFGVEKGPAALFGMSKDHGYVAAYYVETLTLIPMEVYNGAGNKNDVAANRITSCVTGVLFAMVLQLIPPHVRADDPKHIQGYLNGLKNEWSSVLQTMLSEDYEKLKAKGFRSQLSEEVIQSRKDPLRLLKDAEQLKVVDKVIPYFKINEGSRPLLTEMAITESLMADLLEMAVDFLAEEPELIAGVARAELENMASPTNMESDESRADDTQDVFLVEGDAEEKDVEGDAEEQDVEGATGEDVEVIFSTSKSNCEKETAVEGDEPGGRVSICLGLARTINARLKEHQEELDS